MKGPIQPNQEVVFGFFFASFFRSLFLFLSVDVLFLCRCPCISHSRRTLDVPDSTSDLTSPFVTDSFRSFHVFPGKWRSSTSKWAMAFSFHILFTSLFAHNFIILYYNFVFLMPPLTIITSVEFWPLTGQRLIPGMLDERTWRIYRMINGRRNRYTPRNPYSTATLCTNNSTHTAL